MSTNNITDCKYSISKGEDTWSRFNHFLNLISLSVDSHLYKHPA